MSDEPTKAATALDMASRQRDISVSEFFLKNRHLLGFDTPAKALVTAVKEAVDNALDACEEAGILPDISVEVSDRYGKSRVIVEDNGPGIVEGQIARIFGKLLYGSKFHKLSQSRGQQGMGISAAGMYGQLTVGKPLHIISRVEGDEACLGTVCVDRYRQEPAGHPPEEAAAVGSSSRHARRDGDGGPLSEGAAFDRGLSEADRHRQSASDHHLQGPARRGDPFRPQHRRSFRLRPMEIKPHPYGIELGRLIQMLSNTESRTLLRFLVDEFSCVGTKTALKIIEFAGSTPTGN